MIVFVSSFGTVARKMPFFYIHNIQLSREVDYLKSRDRMSCLERNGCSCFEVAVAAAVSARTTSDSHQHCLQVVFRCGRRCCHHCWHLRHHCCQLRHVVIHALHQLLRSVSVLLLLRQACPVDRPRCPSTFAGLQTSPLLDRANSENLP